MSAVRVDTNGAASGAAPDQSQEQDVRIPVEVDAALRLRSPRA